MHARSRVSFGAAASPALMPVLMLAFMLTSGLAAETATVLAAGAPAAPPVAPKAGTGDAMHHEVPDGAFAPVDRTMQARHPAFRAARNGMVSVQVNVDADGNNIVGDAANEPSIAVDPTNSLRAAIGWRQFDTIDDSFRQAGYGWTTDGGRAWTFPGVIEPGVFRSDPVLDADADGNFYYNSLFVGGGEFFCTVFRSADGGRTWDEGVYAFGGDKQWMAIDRAKGLGRGNIYAYWSRNLTDCDGQFTHSYDAGDSYEPCIDIPGSPRSGTLAVGPDGALFAVGAGFIVARSSTLQDPEQTPAFDFSVNVEMDGDLSGRAGPNPGGLLGQAWIAVDHSGGPTHGNIYVLGSVDPPGDDPMDVHFARSTDGGATWSAPVRVNDVPDGWQWFGTMSVAPNGRIDAVWNDSRDDPDGFDSALHYAFSTDAGATWSASVAVSPAWDPHLGWPSQTKIGDYYDMVSDRVGAHVAYAATFNGEQDVYFVRIGDWDCNDNGVGDAQDIAGGRSADFNDDGIPDECQCAADFDGSGTVSFNDLVRLLARFGPCSDCPEDINHDGMVDFTDLLLLLATFGACP